MRKIKISILASGSGTNAENIARFFKDHPAIEVVAILSNRKDAYVLKRAEKLNIPAYAFSGKDLENDLLPILQETHCDYIILAGFLLKIPTDIIRAFPDKILNIHPALLPKYGGKGMYGNKVHEAILANNEPQSGITIHLVNENYDEGRILFQAMCDVQKDDTPDSLASRIHKLEYTYYPEIIEDYILDKEVEVSKNH